MPSPTFASHALLVAAAAFPVAAAVAPAPAQTTAPASQPATLRANSFVPGVPTFDPTKPREVPVTFGPHGLPMVAATIDGHALPPFVFDTGAAAMVITPKSAEKAGLAVNGGIEAAGTGGNVQRPTRRGGAFVLGPLTLTDCTWLDLPELDGPFATLAFGGPVGGIVGRDVLMSGLVELDWVGKRVVLHGNDPAALKAPQLPAGVGWQKLEFVNDLPTVRCTFEGVDGLFMLDTGHDGGVQFEGTSVQKHKLLDGRNTTGGGIAGVGGARKSVKGTLKSFTLAGVDHADVPAAFATQPRPGEPERAGLIGMELLRRYRILIDAPNARIALIPLPKEQWAIVKK
jgi:hypothetical protein